MLRRWVNAEIGKFEKENEWLMATIQGIIKEGDTALRATAYQLKYQFGVGWWKIRRGF